MTKPFEKNTKARFSRLLWKVRRKYLGRLTKRKQESKPLIHDDGDDDFQSCSFRLQVLRGI